MCAILEKEMTSLSDIAQYVTIKIEPGCVLLRPQDKRLNEFSNDVEYGLNRKNKFIPSKYFYDTIGSKLFEQICNLPEYYLTRKELEILASIKNELSKYLVNHDAVVELGSGSASKTRLLLEILSRNHGQIQYYPIDISDITYESVEKLHNEFSNLKITGIVDQYEAGLKLLKSLEKNKIIVFFGSSFGNFEKENGIEFLKKIHQSMNDEDFFLLGVDLVKNKKIIERAYNDAHGITKKFNLNLLSRINLDLGGNFIISNYEHVAFFNSARKRIEMHLQAKTRQNVFIKSTGVSIKLRKGERIRTEFSYKYTIPQIKELAKMTGFKIKEIWTDPQKYFGLVLFSTK